jgi:hypothetical protein
MFAAAIMVWLAAVAAGWRQLTAYSFETDGVAPQSPATWPPDSKLPYEAGRGALLVFLHPKCPCSRATLTELERMLVGPSGPAHPEVRVVVAATTPSSPGADWIITPLIERGQRLPEAELFIDRGGIEAARFGAVSSGTVLYFDATGRRRYVGGVTLARGHEGENLGGAALARLIAGDGRPAGPVPAFGCRLVSEPIGMAACKLAAASSPKIAATRNIPGSGADESSKQSFCKAE